MVHMQAKNVHTYEIFKIKKNMKTKINDIRMMDWFNKRKEKETGKRNIRNI